jgi:hypothetical protein
MRADIRKEWHNKQNMLPAFHIPRIVEMTGNSS